MLAPERWAHPGSACAGLNLQPGHQRGQQKQSCGHVVARLDFSVLRLRRFWSLISTEDNRVPNTMLEYNPRKTVMHDKPSAHGGRLIDAGGSAGAADILRWKPGTRVGIAIEGGRPWKSYRSGGAIHSVNCSRHAIPRSAASEKSGDGWIASLWRRTDLEEACGKKLESVPGTILDEVMARLAPIFE